MTKAKKGARVRVVEKKEDSIDEALRLWKKLCDYEKKNGINIPSFGTMNDLGKRRCLRMRKKIKG